MQYEKEIQEKENALRVEAIRQEKQRKDKEKEERKNMEEEYLSKRFEVMHSLITEESDNRSEKSHRTGRSGVSKVKQWLNVQQHTTPEAVTGIESVPIVISSNVGTTNTAGCVLPAIEPQQPLQQSHKDQATIEDTYQQKLLPKLGMQQTSMQVLSTQAQAGAITVTSTSAQSTSNHPALDHSMQQAVIPSQSPSKQQIPMLRQSKPMQVIVRQQENELVKFQEKQLQPMDIWRSQTRSSFTNTMPQCFPRPRLIPTKNNKLCSVW